MDREIAVHRRAEAPSLHGSERGMIKNGMA
jgi:hypothetical protein